jgi:hypothetical protein
LKNKVDNERLSKQPFDGLELLERERHDARQGIIVFPVRAFWRMAEAPRKAAAGGACATRTMRWNVVLSRKT